jgi:uncharacterized protein YllA (UPF0747 family)
MNKDVIWSRSGLDESMSSDPAEVSNNAMLYRMFQSQLIPAEQL